MRWFWKIPLIGPGIFAIWKADARRKRDWIGTYLPEKARLLEIGAGPGSLLTVLRDDGHDITGLDISDSSFADDLRPTLYDGVSLPYANNSFDVALLLTTLHHTPDPDAIVREAMRVAPRVLVIEDIYRSPLHRRLTKIADAITNLEFFGHPHSNRDDDGWRETFRHLGLKIYHASEKPMAFYFLQALYVLDRAELSPQEVSCKKVA